MKIELKNIKHAEFASEETHCFEASVYIDGKRAGTVENDGRGGCNTYHPYQIEEAINAYAKTLPAKRWKLNDQEFDVHPDADTLISDLLVEHLYARDLKRALSKRVLFVGKDGALRETKAMPKDKLAGLLTHPDLPAKLDSNIILNFMPFTLALQTYRTAGAQA